MKNIRKYLTNHPKLIKFSEKTTEYLINIDRISYLISKEPNKTEIVLDGVTVIHINMKLSDIQKIIETAYLYQNYDPFFYRAAGAQHIHGPNGTTILLSDDEE